MKIAEGEGGAPLRRNSRENLDQILEAMIERPEEQEALAARIEAEFGEDRAVLSLDMSGFSRTTQLRGITAFLLMIHQMKLLARPAIEAAGGILVKSEADNLHCLFPDVPEAVAGARQIMNRLDTVNLLLPEDRRLYASIGIGYGRILNVDEEDMFGDEVNLASKLGEDIAQQGMILLTAAARARADAAGIETREETASISGLSFSYYALV
jgi:adenylate cyclase